MKVRSYKRRDGTKVREHQRIYNNYQKETNMTAKEFEKWSKTECSKKASLNREPIERNKRLLSTPKSKWKNRDFEEAKKTISFNRRMKKVKAGKKVKGCNESKRTISLKNWAYDQNK